MIRVVRRADRLNKESKSILIIFFLFFNAKTVSKIQGTHADISTIVIYIFELFTFV